MNKKTVQMVQIAMMTGVLCVVAPVAIALPFTPVPITFATLILYLIATFLGAKKGTICVFLYLLLGMVGLPIFSGFSGGFMIFAKPTGGYVIGYLPCVFLIGWLLERKKKKVNRMWYLFSFACGTFCCYLFGTIWFMIIMEGTYTVAQTLFVCVVPYLFFDFIKIGIVTELIVPIKQRIGQSGVKG